jgi:hypothetical protein
MSDLQSALPSREAVMSVIGRLEGLGRPAPTESAPAAALPVAAAQPAAESFTLAPAPAPVAPPPAVAQPVAPQPVAPQPVAAQPVVDQAAQARHDQTAALLRDTMAERDAWRSQAIATQTALTQQIEALRAEVGQHLAATEALRAEVAQHLAAAATLRADLDAQHAELAALRAAGEARDGQINHLSAAMTALLELAHSRFDGVAAAAAPGAQPRRRESVGEIRPTEPAASPEPAAPMVIPGLAPVVHSEEARRLGVGKVKLLNQAVAQAPPPPDAFQAAQQQ